MVTKEANEELAQRVKEELLRKTRSTGLDIQVRAVNGWITLIGTVDVLSEKQEAEEIALHVPGVKGVDNDLTVATDGTIEDSQLQEELSQRLVEGGLAGAGVEIKRGTAELVGRVEDKEEKHRAIEIARATPGVKEVVDHLELSE